MFDEENEGAADRPVDPATAAKDKSDELRMSAELFAVFEGCRKFDARLVTGLDAAVARDMQRGVAKLEKAKSPETPVLPEGSKGEAAALLDPAGRGLSTNDYHVHRRPGEVMVMRWLEGEQVGTFYERLQAHFDAALDGHKEDQRQAHEWKQDAKVAAYLDAIDKIEVKMAERYLRDTIKQHGLFVLSTQTTDELNIQYLCDYAMGVTTEELVGEGSAPHAGATEDDLAWFFKLFSLRGIVDGVERMCFFAFLQKTGDSWD